LQYLQFPHDYFIKQEGYDLGISLIEEAKKILNGFMNYVKRQAKKQ